MAALRISIATVTGPTPPGTGVVQLAISATAPVSASPTMRLLPSASVTWLMPMSMTAAPGLTMSAVSRPGTPTATRTTSARRVCAATERVIWWQTVTVAPSAISMKAAGFPTISEWPTTTTSIPSIFMPVALIISTEAAAVQGASAIWL